MPIPSDRPAEPRKAPRQARAKATCAAIVEAAARILEDEGQGALNTNRIAEKAGVSVGTLYQYYPDKESILVALVRRERAALLRDLGAIRPDNRQPIKAMVAVAIDHQFARPKLASALERIETGLRLDAEAAKLAEDTANLSLGLLAGRFKTSDRSDLVTAVLIARALVNAAGENLLPRKGLAVRIESAVTGYLEKVSSQSAGRKG